MSTQLRFGHYEGDLVDIQKSNPVRHGYGTFYYPNNYFIYEGHWENNEKHGQGMFQMGDGSLYEGNFENGEIEGQGLRKFPNGNSYSGQFHLGEFHGEGVFLTPHGDRYEGSWMNNKKHGIGVDILKNGDRYEGHFEVHRRCGQGILYCMNGIRYEGDWKDNVRCGVGREEYPNGDWYDGEWQNDVKNGIGRYFTNDTKLTYEGMWENDQPTMTPVKIMKKPPPPPPELTEEEKEAKRLEEEAAAAAAAKKGGKKGAAPVEEEGPPPIEPTPVAPGYKVDPFELWMADAEENLVDAESGRWISIKLYRDKNGAGPLKPPPAKGKEPDPPALVQVPWKTDGLFCTYDLGMPTANGIIIADMLDIPSGCPPGAYHVKFEDKTDHPAVPLEPFTLVLDVQPEHAPQNPE